MGAWSTLKTWQKVCIVGFGTSMLLQAARPPKTHVTETPVPPAAATAKEPVALAGWSTVPPFDKVAGLELFVNRPSVRKVGDRYEAEVGYNNPAFGHLGSPKPKAGEHASMLVQLRAECEGDMRVTLLRSRAFAHPLDMAISGDAKATDDVGVQPEIVPDVRTSMGGMLLAAASAVCFSAGALQR